MADIADIASDAEQEWLERILKSRPSLIVRPSAKYCGECDNEIPEARRIAIPGVTTCVHCQQLNEQSTNWRK